MRCAVAEKGDKQYLFVVVPASKPAEPAPLPSLMDFGNEQDAKAPPPAQTLPQVDPMEGKYSPSHYFRYGEKVIPCEVDGNGNLHHSVDFSSMDFPSLKEAQRLGGPFSTFVEFPALFGFLLVDKVYFLVATQVEVAAELPFKGHIYHICATQWVPFELPGVLPPQMSSSDRGRLREFQDYVYYKGYYYSDDVDLRLPFPFVVTTDKSNSPDFNCDWSLHLRSGFNNASLRAACSVLIRGFAKENKARLADNSEMHFLLIGRQNTLNPGPRYLGRGLNNAGGAGNDHFYEYVMWRHYNADAVIYARHSILRGTIPVHWSTQTGVSFSEPAMIFSDTPQEVIRGSDKYFDNVFKRLDLLMKTDGQGPSEAEPHVRCINLLRSTSPQHPEHTLTKHFVAAIRSGEKSIKQAFPNGSLDVVHVDWLNIIRDYGINTAAAIFWERAMEFLVREGAGPSDSMMTVGLVRRDGFVNKLRVQNRFVRVNCADSLDRTNIGCYLTCMQISIAMAISLQVSAADFKDTTPVPPLQDFDENGVESGTVEYTPVPGARKIALPFISSWAEARDPKKIAPAIVRNLAELFVYNGDCVAMLYTNSAAMHGNILRNVCGLRSGASNAVIATQRKYENAFEDKKKFRSIELLLGRNKDLHFPSISRSFLLRPIPAERWKCALTIFGNPPGTREADIESAIRLTWDNEVTAWRLSNGLLPIESTALCMTITVEGNVEDRDAYMEAVKSQIAENDPDTEAALEHVKNEAWAIVEFDPELCAAIGAPDQVRLRGRLIVKGKPVLASSYSYNVQAAGENNGAGAMKSMGTQLKKGLKNFVRNLN